MAKILVCIDGSVYADNLCTHAAWAAKNINAEIDLLHVLRRPSDYEAPTDHTGLMGLEARSHLLDELTKVDEERGRLDQEKGKIILEHSAKILKEAGIETINRIHRRGSLVETIQEFEDSVDMIFMGKRGEHAGRSRTSGDAGMDRGYSHCQRAYLWQAAHEKSDECIGLSNQQNEDCKTDERSGYSGSS